MKTTLGRVAPAVAAGIIGASTLFAASPASAATMTVTGTIKLAGANPNTTLYLALCPAGTDCVASQSFTYVGSVSTTNGSFSIANVPAGNYTIAVEGLSNQAGYTDASGASLPGSHGDVYLAPLPTASAGYTVTPSVASAKSLPAAASLGTLTIGQAIHNPTRVVHLSTPGSVGGRPCAGLTTTVSDFAGFTDLPAGGSVTYQWYTGSSPSTAVPIPGATGLTLTPSASLVGQQLLFDAKGTSGDRIAWDGFFGPIDSVGNPGTCTPSVTVASYGRKVGKAIHGKKVAIKGASAPGAGVSYNWTLNGKVVHHGASFKLPKSSKRKKLSAQIVFTQVGHNPVTKTVSFGKVK